MARLTASDMITLVRLGISETSETLSDTQLLRLINQSYLELAGSIDHRELDTSTTITTADGTAEYTLSASDVLRITNITDTTNGIRQREISAYQYDQYTQSETPGGAPVYYYYSGSSGQFKQLTFYPTPDGVYSLTVRYQKKPADLVATPVASATSAVIHELWDDSIVHRAISRAWMLLGDSGKAGQWRQMAQANDQIAAIATRQSSVIPIRPGSRMAQAFRNAKV